MCSHSFWNANHACRNVLIKKYWSRNDQKETEDVLKDNFFPQMLFDIFFMKEKIKTNNIYKSNCKSSNPGF